jgi:hypothetical protein
LRQPWRQSKRWRKTRAAGLSQKGKGEGWGCLATPAAAVAKENGDPRFFFFFLIVLRALSKIPKKGKFMGIFYFIYFFIFLIIYFLILFEHKTQNQGLDSLPVSSPSFFSASHHTGTTALLTLTEREVRYIIPKQR